MSDTSKKAGPALHPDSLLAQAGHWIDPVTGGLTPPVQISSTYARDADNALIGGHYSYGRDHNPQYELVEGVLARLEGGGGALVFSSGMAAAMALVQGLRPGERIALPRIMYWSLRNWLVEFAAHWGLGLDFYDPGDAEGLRAAIQPDRTRLVWVETPANPTWEVTDIGAAAAAAREAGAALAVDSTVPTPVLTRPIEHGADFVFHSATKYLNGHSDIVAGALVAADASHPLWTAAQANRSHNGALLGPFEAWLLLRGLRTLHVRVARQCDTAMAIASHLRGHRKLEAVLYPGLEDHPNHALAARQMHGGFGGMLSIRTKGGRAGALRANGAFNVFVRATSLGGVESLVEHRKSVEGEDSPIPDDLLRLSIGLESPGDLIADLEQALDRI